MEDRINKTIICSVLFLDIVEYSKKSVTGQISLKDRFNTYLSEAIHDVPVTDRIILDTGDGAAVNFLGDVESALTAALRLRASLLAEDPDFEPKLLVRIGINLGPVRLVRDINGQPNIVGDGINVAQRVMGFAEPSQILVSRSYFDAVSRLSAEYTGMFHYQGSRTDKHVRDHEIYAIGYPGDQTVRRIEEGDEALPHASFFDRFRSVVPALSERIKQADSRRRAVYAGMVVVPLLLLAGMLLMPKKPPEKQAETQPVVETMPVIAPVSSPVAPPAPPKASAPVLEKAGKADKTDKADKADKSTVSAKRKAEPLPVKKTPAPAKAADIQGKKTEPAKPEPEDNKPEPVKDSFITISCKDDVQLFVDGANKGKFATGSLTVTVKPGKHKVILTHPSFGIFTDEVVTDAGKTDRLKPKVCN